MSELLEHPNVVANTLIEAGRWIRQFRDKTFVVCIAGDAVDDLSAVQDLLADVFFLQTVGVRPVIVHGGGKRVAAELQDAGIGSDGDGNASTSALISKLEQIVARQINERIAEDFEKIGGRAMTLNFESTPVLTGRLLSSSDPDLGHDSAGFGEVTEVDRLVIDNLCYAGQAPVIPSMCVTDNGQKLMTREIQTAGRLAEQLSAEKLVYLLNDVSLTETKLPASFSAAEAETRFSGSELSTELRQAIQIGGQVLDASVAGIHLVGTDMQHGLLREVFTTAGIGVALTGGPACDT